MKKLVGIILGCALAAGAQAESYSVGINGGSGPGKTSALSFAGFDGSLGTLTGVVFDISATTTYTVTATYPMGTVPPSGTAAYSFTNGLFLYIGGVGANPYVQETGSGTSPLTYGVFTASTAGTHGITTISSSLSAFYATSLSGYSLVDNPSMASFTFNGAPAGTSNIAFDVTSKSLGGSVTYTYTTGRTGLVPEPATWAMMVIGFGLVGGGLRRRSGRPVSA